MKILYLDNNPEEFEVLRQTLGVTHCACLENGFKVIGTRSIEEAELALAAGAFDLVLVEYFLSPEQTTESFIRRLAAKNSGPPVVLVTGNPSMTFADHLLSAISDGHLNILHKQDMNPAALSRLLNDVMGITYKVLIVDDEPDDFALVTMQLGFHNRNRFDCVWAESPEKAREMMRDTSRHFDAFIVDYRMPAEDGTHFIRELVEQHHTQPIVICSGKDTLDLDSELMRLVASRQVRFLSKNNLSTDALVQSLQPVVNATS